MSLAVKANILAVLNRFVPELDLLGRLGVVVSLSVALHGIALVGVTFKPPDMKKSASAATLEVVLVNSKSAARPLKADALAQSNLDGGGNTDADRHAKSPLPVMDQRQADADLAQRQRRVSRMEQQARALMTQVKATHRIEQAPVSPKPVEAPGELPTAADLVSRSLAMARLEAQIDRDQDAYQKRPKRNFVGARTRETRFARYAEDWRIKVEKVGNLNYPEEARRKKIYGSLQLLVNIKADGSVESIEIRHSSGHKELDEAAKRIVNLAAPYAPLPEDIRKDTDILGIVRTWTFTRADQLDTAAFAE
ncbi:MAG: TonB family protein [Sulfuricella sp.]|nr:TonB family protein [Sulfuricella sp.]